MEYLLRVSLLYYVHSNVQTNYSLFVKNIFIIINNNLRLRMYNNQIQYR